MADNLMFPIGFDLDEAVKKAGQEWNSTYADKLEKAIQKRAINVRLQLDVKSITDLTARVSGISGLSPKVTPKIDTSSFEGALKSLQSSLQAVDYESLTEDEASAINTLTKAVNSLARAYAEKNKAAALEDRTTQELKAATAVEKRAKAELATAKAIEQRAKKEANVATAKANQTKAEENAAAAAARRAKAEEAHIAALNRRKKSENDLAASAARMEKAQLALANAQNKTANATRNANREFHNQDGYVSRLIKRLAVYAGFQQINNFLTSVREVTAQFELQRVSLGAIIQDQQRANQLFAEIKSFALTSPLKILDLTTYTKQVAAYGFETEKLFDTTKMLADISVGLGTDMSRATLFFGQVFATGYLRASELRQATEMGIPLVDKLAKKLEELNGRVYSAADVMDLISKRAISFELVESVFKDMTSAGGEFYNMQVKQSQTLFGMWSKLGDAAALMYDEIGNTSSVNAGMKASIGLLETLMRNWKTTARVLDTVVAGLAAYALVTKNAAISTGALRGTTALLNLAHKQEVIQLPKIIAARLSANNATKVSTFLTKIHTAAVLRHATATNILTKAFWKLTAAMLSNPWGIAAAAIGAAVAALIHFTGNAETAAERVEKLNNSVASLKNLDDTTKPLIDTYNELINKTERTAEEQKKLSEVTHELAKQYPGAVTAIGNFGNEVDLAADKLNKLYQAEKQARMENTRYELEKTEAKIQETNGEIEKLQKKLEGGTKTVYRRLGDSGLQTKKIVPLTEEDKGEILRQIEELRHGEDGQSGLIGLQQSAEEARRALGLIPSEAAQAIGKFGGWKKTLTTFRQQVGDVRVQLFDDSTIAQFGSLEEALKKTAEEYKKNIALVAAYDERLKSANITSTEKAQIESERAEADAMATLAKKALEYYNALSLLNSASSSGGGRTASDNRLSQLREIEQTLTTINSKYEELLKKEGQTKALADIQKIYGETLKYINKLGDRFKLNFAMPTEFSTLQEYRKAIQDVIEELKMKGYEKAALELETKIGTGDVDKLSKELEEKIKALADRISRTKTAREFYEKILSQTGDIELATNVSLAIYGQTGEDLFNETIEQIREVFKSGKSDVIIDVEAAIDTTNQRIDYKMLADIYEKYQDALIEKNRDTANKIVQEGQKTAAQNISNWQNELAKAKSFEEQRTEIIKRESERRANIIKENRDPKSRSQQVSLSYDKQTQDLAKLAVDEFKSSDDYIKVFQDLDRVSTQTLERMTRRLNEMIAVAKEGENVEGMKTLVEQLEKIKDEKDTRNPIQGVIDSFKEYAKARKDFRMAEAEEAKAKAEFAQQEIGLNQAIADAKALQITAQQRVTDLEAQGKLNTAEGVAAQLALNDATTKVTQATERRNQAVKKVEKAEQKTTDALDAQKAAIAKLSKNVNAMANAFSSAASSIQTIAEMMGVAEDSALGDIVNGLVSGLNTAATIMTTILTIAIAIEAACWWLLAIGAALSVFSALGSWLTGSKVRKANKEIERQKELIEQLEYSYKRLEEASDKLFGRDYISNYNAQIRNLQAQQTAYLKQAEAERSKGKKADEDKIKEYENSARDAADEIKKLQDDLTAHFVGSDRAGLAREFARSWLEAKASFASTTDAIKSKYKDMIQSMIVEGAAAKVIDAILAPMWDQMDKMLGENDITGAIDYLVNGMDQFVADADNGMNVLWKSLEAKGYDMKKLLGDTGGEYTGISRDVASASEESINGLAAGINTQNYYISHVPNIAENVAVIRALMEGGHTTSIPTATAGWTDWQQQAMDSYVAIQRNTADAVVECRRIAVACEEEVAQLRRVIVPRGTKGSHGVQVYM